MCVADRFYEDIRACDKPMLEQYKDDLQRVGDGDGDGLNDLQRVGDGDGDGLGDLERDRLGNVVGGSQAHVVSHTRKWPHSWNYTCLSATGCWGQDGVPPQLAVGAATSPTNPVRRFEELCVRAH